MCTEVAPIMMMMTDIMMMRVLHTPIDPRMRRMTIMMVAFVKIMIKITKIMMMRLLRTPIDPT